MKDDDSNGWGEYRKFVVEELTRNRQVHDQIVLEVAKLRDSVDKRQCVERQELHEVERRIIEVEKMIENFRGRFFILAAGIGISGAIVSRLITFMLEHGKAVP